MGKPKTIVSAMADVAARRFAKSQHLNIDDPIVLDLRRGLAMKFGWRRWKNRIDADKAQRQPSLDFGIAESRGGSQRT